MLEIQQCASCHILKTEGQLKIVCTGSEFRERWVDLENSERGERWILENYTALLCNECIGRIEMYD